MQAALVACTAAHPSTFRSCSPHRQQLLVACSYLSCRCSGHLYQQEPLPVSHTDHSAHQGSGVRDRRRPAAALHCIGERRSRGETGMHIACTRLGGGGEVMSSSGVPCDTDDSAHQGSRVRGRRRSAAALHRAGERGRSDMHAQCALAWGCRGREGGVQQRGAAAAAGCLFGTALDVWCCWCCWCCRVQR